MPKQWVILDNATFHHGSGIAQLIEAAGAQVVYLPCIHLTSIAPSKCWAWLKSQIRKQLRHSNTLHSGYRHRSQTRCVLISVAIAIVAKTVLIEMSATRLKDLGYYYLE